MSPRIQQTMQGRSLIKDLQLNHRGSFNDFEQFGIYFGRVKVLQAEIDYLITPLVDTTQRDTLQFGRGT